MAVANEAPGRKWSKTDVSFQAHFPKAKGKISHEEETAFVNARKSRARGSVEHLFAHQKKLMGLIARTIGLARARLKIGLANFVYTCGASFG